MSGRRKEENEENDFDDDDDVETNGIISSNKNGTTIMRKYDKKKKKKKKKNISKMKKEKVGGKRNKYNHSFKQKYFPSVSSPTSVWKIQGILSTIALIGIFSLYPQTNMTNIEKEISNVPAPVRVPTNTSIITKKVKTKAKAETKITRRQRLEQMRRQFQKPLSVHQQQERGNRQRQQQRRNGQSSQQNSNSIQQREFQFVCHSPKRIAANQYTTGMKEIIEKRLQVQHENINDHRLPAEEDAQQQWRQQQQEENDDVVPTYKTWLRQQKEQVISTTTTTTTASSKINNASKIQKIYYIDTQTDDERKAYMDQWLYQSQPSTPHYQDISCKYKDTGKTMTRSQTYLDLLEQHETSIKTLIGQDNEKRHSGGSFLIVEDDYKIQNFGGNFKGGGSSTSTLARIQRAMEYIPNDYDIIRLDCFFIQNRIHYYNEMLQNRKQNDQHHHQQTRTNIIIPKMRLMWFDDEDKYEIWKFESPSSMLSSSTPSTSSSSSFYPCNDYASGTHAMIWQTNHISKYRSFFEKYKYNITTRAHMDCWLGHFSSSGSSDSAGNTETFNHYCINFGKQNRNKYNNIKKRKQFKQSEEQNDGNEEAKNSNKNKTNENDNSKNNKYISMKPQIVKPIGCFHHLKREKVNHPNLESQLSLTMIQRQKGQRKKEQEQDEPSDETNKKKKNDNDENNNNDYYNYYENQFMYASKTYSYRYSKNLFSVNTLNEYIGDDSDDDVIWHFPVIVTGIISIPNAVLQRQVIRQTWGATNLIVFIIAGNFEDIQEEFYTYDDIVWLNNIEDYNTGLTPKTCCLIHFGASISSYTHNTIVRNTNFSSTSTYPDRPTFPIDYIFKTDDDIYANLTQFQMDLSCPASYYKDDYKPIFDDGDDDGERKDDHQLIHVIPSTSLYSPYNDPIDYFGILLENTKPIRDVKSKFFIPSTIYQRNNFPTYTVGAGYILSVRFASCAAYVMETMNVMWWEDVATGLLAEKCHVTPIRAKWDWRRVEYPFYGNSYLSSSSSSSASSSPSSTDTLQNHVDLIHQMNVDDMMTIHQNKALDITNEWHRGAYKCDDVWI